MNENERSAFDFYSLGIVAITKKRNTDLVMVIPIEKLTIGHGDIEELKATGGTTVNFKVQAKNKLLKEQEMKYDITLKDHQGVDKTKVVKGDLMIEAKWSAIGQSNRITSPDVVEGETVMLYKVADTDEYYWTTHMREPEIRRLETVLYGYCNIPEGLKAFDKTTSYWMEVSTHDKYVHVHTAKNDGEPFEYDVKIDTAKGIVTITDNSGNSIELFSQDSRLVATTNEDIELNTKRVTINASEKVDVNTPITTFSGDVHVMKNETIDGNLTVGGVTNLKSLNTSGDTILTGGTITANGENLSVDNT